VQRRHGGDPVGSASTLGGASIHVWGQRRSKVVAPGNWADHGESIGGRVVAGGCRRPEMGPGRVGPNSPVLRVREREKIAEGGGLFSKNQIFLSFMTDSIFLTIYRKNPIFKYS
jgi:hypothetical protein